MFHYLGDTSFLSTINYGAYKKGLCLGAISFGSPNAKKLKGYYDENPQAGWYEIKRLAMSDVCPKNSESRFISIAIKLFRKMFEVKGIITLADTEQNHTGIIYKASGFDYKGLTAYKCDYVVNGKKLQRGKVKDMGGSWIPRSQKHLFVKKFLN